MTQTEILNAPNVIDVTAMSDDDLDALLMGAALGETRGAAGARQGLAWKRACDATRAQDERDEAAIDAHEERIAAVDLRCRKCSGRGHLPHYNHVDHGVCFRCEGSGEEPAVALEVDRRRGEIRCRRAEISRRAQGPAELVDFGTDPFALVDFIG